jgi:hypothetical protein
VDETFNPSGEDLIWWEGFNPKKDWRWFKKRIRKNKLTFQRAVDAYSDVSLFEPDGQLDWTDVVQGRLSNSYLKASMAALSEFPDLVRAIF